MSPAKGEGNSGHDTHPARQQISFPWDEPPDKWKIQFHYTRLFGINGENMNQYSLASNETSEAGGFEYENCPEIFFSRTGYGALRMAWDTNILIDNAKYGQLIWEDDEFNPPVSEDRYREELIALSTIMNLWMLRDIRIKMPFRQIWDAKLRLAGKPEELRAKEIQQFRKTRDIRLWQLEQFHSALSCISLDAEIDANVEPFATLPEGSTNDDWDKSLLAESIATGCHVFLTGDRKLKSKLDNMACDSCVAILSPTGLVDLLTQADEITFARTGQSIMPDSHKFVHVLEAHENGYPGQ